MQRKKRETTPASRNGDPSGPKGKNISNLINDKINEHHLRSCMLDGLPCNNEAEEIETPVLESAKMLVSIFEGEGPANKRDLGSVCFQEALGLV